MSQHDPQTLRRELLIEEGINQQMDALVRLANQNAALLERNPRMEESQLRNLLSVSIESRSVEVVLNYIRYQIGRSSNAWGSGQKDFGHVVIRTITGKLFDLVIQALKAAQIELPQNDNSTPAGEAAYRLQLLELPVVQKVNIRLVQLYLGYLQRAFYYGNKTKDFKTLLDVASSAVGEKNENAIN
jgi:hypothetical protein